MPQLHTHDIQHEINMPLLHITNFHIPMRKLLNISFVFKM